MKVFYISLLLGLFLLSSGCKETKPDPSPVTKQSSSENTPTRPFNDYVILEDERLPDIVQEIGIVTGGSNGTYIRFGQDIANVARGIGIEIQVKESKGTLDNAKRINSIENAALGIVQADISGYLSRERNTIADNSSEVFSLIFPLYNEEVHLFARKTIRSLQDLQGKKVSIGERSSGNALTATNLLKMMNITPARIIQNYNPDKSAIAVLRGDIDAMFFVGGKPVETFVKIGDSRNIRGMEHLLDNVHFVPLGDASVFSEYKRATLGPNDYPWMKAEVSTIAVQALLIGYNFSSRKNPFFQVRCSQLARLSRAIRGNINALKRTGHPKWREVDLDSEVGRWKQDICTQS